MDGQSSSQTKVLDFYLSPVSLLQIADCRLQIATNVRYSIHQNTNSSLLGCTVLMRLTSYISHLTSYVLHTTHYTSLLVIFPYLSPLALCLLLLYLRSLLQG